MKGEEFEVDAKEEEMGIDAYEKENKEEEKVEEERMEKWLVTKEASVAYEHPQRECKISHYTNKGEVCSLNQEKESCDSYGYIVVLTQRLSHDKFIHFNPRSLVSLCFYKICRDSLYCKITSMDSCHTLLEGPKLLDRNIMPLDASLLPSYTTRPKKEESHLVSIMKMEYRGNKEYKDLILIHLEKNEMDPSIHHILNLPTKHTFHEHPKDIYSDHLVERPKIRKDEIAQVIKVHCFILNDKGKVVRIDLGSEKQREQPTFTVKKRKSKSYGVRELIGRKFKKFIKGMYDDFKAFKKKVYVKKASKG
jgi:hypothetical protein